MLRLSHAAVLTGAAFMFSSSLAADSSTASSATERYQQERAACHTGQTSQELASCLREAGAVLQQARRGDPQAPTQRAGANGPDYAANALKRCDVLPADDRRACIARIQGDGTQRGSVASGGIYRELVVIEPAADEQDDEDTPQPPAKP